MTYSQLRGPADAQLLIIGDSPTKNDIEAGIPFSSQGAIFLHHQLSVVGIDFAECRAMTALDFWPQQGKAANIFHTKTEGKKRSDLRLVHDQYVDQRTLACGKKVWEEIDRLKPKFILALGGVALWYLTGQNSITKWRGSMLVVERPWGTIRLLPTYHPSAVMRKLEWKHVLRHDLARIDLTGDSWDKPDNNFTVHRDADTLLARLRLIYDSLRDTTRHIACDIETRGGYITVLGFGYSATDADVIPFTHFAEGNVWTAEEEGEIMVWVKRILEHPNARISGQNFHYDEQYLVKLYGIKANTAYDSMHMQHVFTTKNLPLKLDFLASLHCAHYVYWKDDGKDFHKGVKSEEDQQLYWVYNGSDCCNTWEIVESLLPNIEDSWAEPVNDFQREMYEPVLRPMLRGINFDRKKQAKFLGEMRILKEHYEEWFTTMLPEEWFPLPKTKAARAKYSPWWNSPAKQKELFYDILSQQKILKRQPNGFRTPTTDDAALSLIGKREPVLRPLCEKIQEYRSINLFIFLYLDSPASPEDGRMRTNYDLAGTSTFRLASRKDAFGQGLNLQNITKG